MPAFQRVQFQAVVTNAGPRAADGVILTLEGAEPLTIDGDSVSGGCSLGEQGRVTCPFGRLEPGQSRPAFLEVYSATAGPGLRLTATVDSDSFDNDPSDDQATASLTVVPGVADLAVDVTGPSLVVAGEVRSFDINVAPPRPDAAGVSELDVSVSGGGVLTSLSGSPWSCTVIGGVGRCTVPSLLGATSVRATVVADGSTSDVTIDAQVRSTTFDPTTSDNADALVAAVVPAGTADLQIDASTTSSAIFVVGTPIVVSAPVENLGPAAVASDVVATFTVPDDFRLTGVTPPNPSWTCGIDAGTATCRTAGLARGVRPVMTATLLPVRRGPGGAIRVDVGSAGPDPVPTNNTRRIPPLEIFDTRADLTVSVDAPPVIELAASQSVVVTVSNSDFVSPASGVALTVSLPEQLELASAPDFPCTAEGGLITCNTGLLLRAQAVTYRFDVLANASTTNAAIVATATSFTADANPADNTAQAVVEVPVVAPPPAPTPPVAYARDGGALVTWAPLPDGVDVTGYLVEYSSDGGRTWVASDQGPVDNIVLGVGPLTNGVSYVFRLTAVNRGGPGTPSSVSNAVTPLPAPRAPTSVRASASRRVVTLSWRAPDPRGRLRVTDYLIEMTTDGVNWVTVDDPVSTRTSLTITGLPRGRYRFRVVALSNDSFGEYSRPSNRVTV